MIPKIIHYCWFGKHPLPEHNQRCLQSWQRLCSDFKIVRWSEANFDCDRYPFTKRAYRLRNWSAISDYVRLYALKKMGGVYLDTDVKMIRSIRPLLNQMAFIGMENPRAIASGLIFGTEPNDPNVNELLKIYNHLGKLDKFESLLNDQVYITTAHFRRAGFRFINQKQVVDNCLIYPTSYFCPEMLDDSKPKLTTHTYTIHEYDGSWSSENERERQVTFNLELNSKLSFYLKLMN